VLCDAAGLSDSQLSEASGTQSPQTTATGASVSQAKEEVKPAESVKFSPDLIPEVSTITFSTL
jgi:hypothetical protein